MTDGVSAMFEREDYKRKNAGGVAGGPMGPIGSKMTIAQGASVLTLGNGESLTLGPNVTKGLEQGRKFDSNKLEYGLLPPLALEETVKVLTFGAQKYARDNWQFVPDSKRRYFDALQRHVWAWKQGETLDPESGIHHLAHAMCCLMFLYEHDVKYSKQDIDKNLAEEYNNNVIL